MASLRIEEERRASDDRRRAADRRHPDPECVRRPGTMDRRTGWQRRHADRRGKGPLPPPPDTSAT